MTARTNPQRAWQWRLEEPLERKVPSGEHPVNQRTKIYFRGSGGLGGEVEAKLTAAGFWLWNNSPATLGAALAAVLVNRSAGPAFSIESPDPSAPEYPPRPSKRQLRQSFRRFQPLSPAERESLRRRLLALTPNERAAAVAALAGAGK